MASIPPPLILLMITILSLSQLVNFSIALGGGGGRNGPLVGGWKPIEDPNDPKVAEIGAFAVNQHNKETKETLTFNKVVSGETQVVSGINYKLIISATGGGGSSSNYEAVVYDVPWKHLRQLISFKKA